MDMFNQNLNQIFRLYLLCKELIMKRIWFFVIPFVACSCVGDKHSISEESLVYLKSKEGNFDLYQSDILGQWEERITTNSGWDWSPRWNSTLERLVYYTNDTLRNFAVVAMDLRSARVDTLPNGDLPDYQLTPDGKRIIYSLSEGGSQNIMWSELDGSAVEMLTDYDAYNGRFSVSPNGRWLAFISDRSGSNELYLLDLIEFEIKRLTYNEMIEKYSSWSPDSRQIAFTMRKKGEDTKEDIYLMNVDGTGLRQVTATPYAEQEIAWSLRGDKIAFHGTTVSDGDQIYTIDLKDGKFTKITSGNYYHGEPCWVPNHH